MNNQPARGPILTDVNAPVQIAFHEKAPLSLRSITQWTMVAAIGVVSLIIVSMIVLSFLTLWDSLGHTATGSLTAFGIVASLVILSTHVILSHLTHRLSR